MKHMKHLPVRAACDEPFERLRLCRICRHTDEVDGSRRCSRLVAASPALREMLADAAIVAQSDSSVVITGETGSGKEVVARLLHANSRRANQPFVAVNVAALPPELLESELFGHVRGAFTGAVTSTQGLFGEAQGGTLLLDEIGEMPLALQAKLLRVLQERELRRVGESKGRAIDVRVLCATHRDVRELVRSGRFREDLYYRLKVFLLCVPPLRERKEDIVPLAHRFAEQAGAPAIELLPATVSALESYSWPGNLRELSNAVEHAVAFARGGSVAPGHLPEEVRAGPAPERSTAWKSLAEVTRDHVREVLRACDGNQVAAAKVLGIGRSTLWRKLQEL
jgi:transcriptional regulator with PAS, ATPase and Fis domain